MRFKIIITLLIALFFHSNKISSQNLQEEYTFEDIENGATQRAITSIAQDEKGIIWMGTNGVGLVHFNGIENKIYKQILSDSTSINSSLIHTIFIDSSKRLWVGTEAGLNLYNPMNDTFSEINFSKDDSVVNERIRINTIKESETGKLYIGSNEDGLFELDPNTLETKKILLQKPYKAKNLVINSIIVGADNTIYVGTKKGLFSYKEGSQFLKPENLGKGNTSMAISDEIRVLLMDKDENLWIGTASNGLIKVQNETHGQPIIKRYKITSKRILSLALAPDENILCGTENDGLFVLDITGNVITNYRSDRLHTKSVKSNSIWSLFVDNQNRIWVGYYNKGVGIYDKYYDKFFDVVSLTNVPNSLQSPSVTCMVKDDNGNIWMGMDGGGVDIYNISEKTFVHLADPNNGYINGLSSSDVQAIFIDSKKNVWVGTWSSGIYFLKEGSSKFLSYTISNTNGGLTSNSITSFSEDSSGTIWVGAFFNGLHSYNPKNEKFTPHNGAPFNETMIGESNIRKILVDYDDAIWLATTKGIFKVIKTKEGFSMPSLNKKIFNNQASELYSTIIVSLYQDKKKNIWIGTDGSGLCKYNSLDGTYKWYNKSNGLVQGTVASIIEDESGNIWLGGEAGLSKLNITTDTFLNYTKNDGLLTNDFNYNSVFNDENGLLYFGNYEGVNYFNPNKILLNKNESFLYFTDFRLFNKSVIPGRNSLLKKTISETEKISLNHKESVFTIEFVGINYTRPQNNQYAYYLENFDKNWNFIGNNRSATYTNLSPGDYTFKVKSANNDGIWNENPITLNISVLPPWWNTNWAIFTYFLFFLLLTYFVSKFINQRLKEKRLINFERDKSRQEEILNEKKIQFFTNISHEFRTPLTLILNPLRDLEENPKYKLNQNVKDKHKIIMKNATRLVRLINELMDFRKLQMNKMSLNATKINIHAFVQEVSSHFEEDASEKNILFSFQSDDSALDVWGDLAMLEKTIFNILSNAFKATPKSGTITVAVYRCKERIKFPLIDKNKAISSVEIVIKDTGMGIKKEEVERIFERFYQSKEMNRQYYGGLGTGIGLEVAQNFISLHKGKIEVNSIEGLGTTFKIFLPLGNSHFLESELVLANRLKMSNESEFSAIREVENELKKKILEEEDSLKKHEKSTLLILEDNVGLRKYLKTELENEYKIIEAENGEYGLKVAASGIPDVIITDVIMPEMDGLEFCRLMKQDIKTCHIPILMLTAKAMSDDKIKGIDSGADAYLIKPFEMKVLRSYLRRLINNRQLYLNNYFANKGAIKISDNTTPLDKSFITKVLNYINENIADIDLNVEHLADDMHLSRSQLYRKIKAMTGMTANEFIRKIRLERAKNLLENGSESISEVGFKVGFSSPSYFTKCFKTHFGILPTEVMSN